MIVVLGEASLKYVERPRLWKVVYYISIYTMEKVQNILWVEISYTIIGTVYNAVRSHFDYMQNEKISFLNRLLIFVLPEFV